MQRIKHDLLQGSDPWKAFRAEHYGASEASAMLGMSPYVTRDELLKQKATGLVKEVDVSTQKVFDNGHTVEKAARPIVEKVIDTELSAVTMSYGKLSASCDGLDYFDVIAWENKQFNKAHYEQVTNGELPEIHWPQCQQVLHVTGAEKLYFTISNGTPEKTAGVWVYPDQSKINRIIAGWEQFEKDLAEYVPPTIIEKVEAETVKTLPVPSVVVRGEITASNLNEITPLFDNYLGSIKTELSTDQDFADAEANSKNCRETAKRIQSLRENIIAQMVDVNAVDSALSNYEDAFNKVGLQLEKAVKEQKEALKTKSIMKAKVEYADFVTELNKDIPVMLSSKLVCPDFAGSIKGVKTIQSMHSRINDALANGKSEATILANDVKTKLAYINEAIKGYEHLFNINSFIFADIEYIKLNIQVAKQSEDERKTKREAEIKAHAEAEARAKIEAEQRAKEQAEAKAVVSPTLEEVLNVVAPKEISQVFTKLPESLDAPFEAIFESKTPSANELVTVISTYYQVDKPIAHKWLLETDFTELLKAA